MKVLVFNCGSSSLKYKIIALPEGEVIAGGEAQRVGPKTSEPARIFHRQDGREEIIETEMENHERAFAKVMQILESDPELAPDAVGHRVVHGAEKFKDAAIMTPESLKELESLNEMAPLHNPPAAALIRACFEKYPSLPQVAVFDTAYHSSIPDYAGIYPIPLGLAKKMGIRKYGFHGTSHQFVVEETAAFLNIPSDEFNAVSCHLGSGGASLCAVRNGKSIDNTMGYSPLQGLVMSTRCGDLDPGVALRLLSGENGSGDRLEALLNQKSGVLGLSGISSDIRDILAKENGRAGARSVLRETESLYLWRIRKYLGAYLAAVGHPHALIFTDTVGETMPYVRWAVCANLSPFGIELDEAKNESSGKLPMDIATRKSPVRVVVVATNEELAIAGRAARLLGEENKTGKRKP
ncbi:MAG: acetate/propionate family kinase [Victivallaceae bacterium]|nr:acetate/propionate family kinase [Victivallaceae bacterium]